MWVSPGARPHGCDTEAHEGRAGDDTVAIACAPCTGHRCACQSDDGSGWSGAVSDIGGQPAARGGRSPTEAAHQMRELIAQTPTGTGAPGGVGAPLSSSVIVPGIVAKRSTPDGQ